MTPASSFHRVGVGHRNAKDLRSIRSRKAANVPLQPEWKLSMCVDKSAYMSRSLDLGMRPIRIRVLILLRRQEG
jgi:hypothetical protein